eukprot:7389869-Prymnesium_polylepis.1
MKPYGGGAAPPRGCRKKISSFAFSWTFSPFLSFLSLRYVPFAEQSSTHIVYAGCAIAIVTSSSSSSSPSAIEILQWTDEMWLSA